MKVSVRLASAGLLLLGASFVYGYAVAKKKIFPHAWIVAAQDALRSEESSEPGPAVKTFMPTGWWVPQPGADGVEDMLASLDDLGYAQVYRTADENDEHGVIIHDETRVQAGHNLILSAHEPSVTLSDMDGRKLHEWSFSFDDVPAPPDYVPPGVFGARCFRRARLLESGELLAIYDRMGLIKIDRDSKLIWGKVGYYHHDLDVTSDGTIHVLVHDIKVIPRIHETRRTFEDFVVRLSPEGEELGRFSLLEALENSPYASFLRKADPGREDIFHTNTIQVFDGSLAHLSPFFAEGMLLVSLWGLDVVAIVDPEQEQVVWALSGMWHRQHEPLLLANGNMLLFDNMGHGGRSKVIEFEPFTQKVVWSFEGDDENNFYSELCGSSQRLSNGNTLITESLGGRAFEVTPGGEFVWYWSSPHRVKQPIDGEEVSGVAVLMEVVRLETGFPLDWLD